MQYQHIDSDSNVAFMAIEALAIGNFDGMHIAHQVLFDTLPHQGGILCIDAPWSNLTPHGFRSRYTTLPIYAFDFDQIKNWDPKTFCTKLSATFPSLKHIVVGYDFKMGKNRSCDVVCLKELLKPHITTQVISPISIQNQAVHSKLIRQWIEQGELSKAKQYLGYAYGIHGVSAQGQGLGKKQFVPTVNVLNQYGFLLPPHGVYATHTLLQNNTYPSVSFLGNRQTTDGCFAIETHIIDSKDGALTVQEGEEVGIVFDVYLRSNQAFKTPQDLKQQILQDIQNAKTYHH